MPKRYLRISIFATFSLIFVATIAYLATKSGIRQFPDTEVYFNLARRPSTLMDLVFGLRPFLFIVYLKVLGTNENTIAALQTIAYIMAWTYLCYVALFDIRSIYVATIAGGAACLFGLYPEFALWNKTILSELLSFSFTVLSIAFLMKVDL